LAKNHKAGSNTALEQITAAAGQVSAPYGASIRQLRGDFDRYILRDLPASCRFRSLKGSLPTTPFPRFS